jgi:hypothetical protein
VLRTKLGSLQETQGDSKRAVFGRFQIERSKPVGRFVQIWDVLSRGLLHELLQQTHDVYVSGDCSGSIDQLRGVRVSLTVVLIVTANPVESLASLVATLWN